MKYDIPLSNNHQASIARAVQEHQQAFHDYCINYVSIDDAIYTFVAESLVVDDVYVNGDRVRIKCQFQLSYFDGCKGMASVDEHRISLPFILGQDHVLKFDEPDSERWSVG